MANLAHFQVHERQSDESTHPRVKATLTIGRKYGAMTALYPPLFLSVGAMKAGTTWLFSVLGRHPALHVTMEKEIHYFHHRYIDPRKLSEAYRLEEARARYLRRFDPKRSNIARVRQNLHWISNYLSSPVDDHWYRNLFALRDGERWACDFSNLNAHLPLEAWPQIAERAADLRVLFTMRHPLERLWSHVKFHLEVTGQSDCLADWGPEEMDRFARQAHIWDNGEYGTILRRLDAALLDGQFLALFYEEIHADRVAALVQIEQFLNLPPHRYPEALIARRFTESPALAMPPYFADLFASDMIRIRQEVAEVGFRPPECWS
jgi:hypothetical protein